MISGSRANVCEATVPTDSGRASCSTVVQSLVLPGLPTGGPDTVHPPSGSLASSNDVVPWPVETATSSIAMTPWLYASLMYVRETSTDRPR